MLACLKKIYDKPSSIFKSRDITLLKNFSINKTMIFSSCHIWMWQLEHEEWWEMKNWRFWTVVLDKNLECPLDYKEIHLVIRKEINPEYSLEGWMLKLNLQHFGQLMWRTYLLEKTLLLGKIEGRRRKGWQRVRWLYGISDSMTWVWARSRSWWRTEKPGVLQSMGLQRIWHDLMTK